MGVAMGFRKFKLFSAGVLAALPTAAFAQDMTVNKGDTAWMLTSTVLVMLMILPGLALFYGGLVRTKNMLSLLSQVLGIASVSIIGWVIYAYSFAFNGTGAVLGDFEQGERLPVIAERVPRPRLEQLVERADAAGKSDERVAQLGHPCLALVQGADPHQLGQPRMGDLVGHQRLGNHAIGAAAALEHRVGDRSHQPEAAAAVHQVDSLLGHVDPERPRRLGIGAIGAGRGAAVDREPSQPHGFCPLPPCIGAPRP